MVEGRQKSRIGRGGRAVEGHLEVPNGEGSAVEGHLEVPNGEGSAVEGHLEVPNRKEE